MRPWVIDGDTLCPTRRFEGIFFEWGLLIIEILKLIKRIQSLFNP